MENYTFRLKSGQDLFQAIQEFVDGENIEAGCVVSAVGSLRRADLRCATMELGSKIFTRAGIAFLAFDTDVYNREIAED